MDGGSVLCINDDCSHGGAENTATQVTALIMAGASVVAYIIGEGLTDSANIGVEVETEVEMDDTEE